MNKRRVNVRLPSEVKIDRCILDAGCECISRWQGMTLSPFSLITVEIRTSITVWSRQAIVAEGIRIFDS